jgi:hypothetical protein
VEPAPVGVEDNGVLGAGAAARGGALQRYKNQIGRFTSAETTRTVLAVILGWVSAVFVPTCWAEATAAKARARREARGNMATEGPVGGFAARQKAGVRESSS